MRPGWQSRVPEDRRVGTPGDQQHNHHGHQLHDDQSLVAGLWNALRVLPPEIDGHENRKTRRDEIHLVCSKRIAQVRVLKQLADQSGQILPGSDAADGASQDVVEHQRGDAEFCERSAERLFDRAVHAAAHEHAAALDVHGAHRVRKQHDGQNEPRRGFADVAFRFTARVIGRGGQVVQNDGRGAPERNKGEKRGRGDDDARNAVAPAACGGRGFGGAAHVRVISISGLKCSHFSAAKSSDRPILLRVKRFF